jgi:hypothetical protein
MTVSAAVPSTVSSETSGATAGCVVASTTTASASGICAFNRIGARIGTSAGPPPTAAAPEIRHETATMTIAAVPSETP